MGLVILIVIMSLEVNVFQLWMDVHCLQNLVQISLHVFVSANFTCRRFTKLWHDVMY